MALIAATLFFAEIMRFDKSTIGQIDHAGLMIAHTAAKAVKTPLFPQNGINNPIFPVRHTYGLKDSGLWLSFTKFYGSGM